MLKRLFSVLAQAWVILGISLLLLFLTDRLLLTLLPAPAGDAAFNPAAVAPARERAAAVTGDDWIGQYWREHARSRHTEWVSYVYWRRRPYAGELIHVDQHGFRVTPQGQAQAERSIWLFGGSTVWGTGNRDSGTLAAQLQQIYREQAPDLHVRVQNFGESGYVSRQTLSAFQSALACPEPPADLAIFLDGANDVYSVYQSGMVGLPQNEDNRRREFNASRQFSATAKAWMLRLEGIMRLAGVSAMKLNESEFPALAQAAAANYLAVVRQAQALGAAYGVDVLYGWQPTVFDRVPALADEPAITGASPSTHVRLQRLVTAQVRAQLGPELSVADLSGAFDAEASPVFFDFVHLSEAGQRLLAHKLYQLSIERLRQRPSRPITLDQCRDRPLG